MATTSPTARDRAAGSSNQSELNSWLVEEMYEQYREDPASLPRSWQEFFEGYRPEDSAATSGSGAASGNGERAASVTSGSPATAPAHERTATDGASPAPARRAVASVPSDGPQPQRLRGVGARIVENMEVSLGVPTATSVRDVPAKLLEVNRRIVNNYLRRTRGGKVSFTHLIAYALVKAVDAVPAMMNTFAETEDGKPAVLRPAAFGLGLAVDVENDDGTRSLLVPVIQDAATLSFEAFLRAYEELIRKIRTRKLDPAMFAGATITLTNPGTIGTVHSIPRLMAGQSAILGVGTIDYPAEYRAAAPTTLARLGVGKVVTLTSTYDHRVIQGAESGLYLDRVSALLLGEDGFYDEVFASLGLPYEPARWRTDVGGVDGEAALLEKQLRVGELANMYRVRGHLIADLDPLRQQAPSMHPELDPTYYGLSIWDLDREFLTELGGSVKRLPLSELLSVLRDAYCRTIGIEYGHVLDPEQKRWIREQVEGVTEDVTAEDQRWILERLNAAEAFESFLHTKYVGQKRFGLEGAESLIPLLDAIAESAADDEHVSDIVMGMAHRGRLNVLSNTLGKSHQQIFGEFEGHIDPDTVQGSGDVKYHLGTTGTYTARSGATVDLHLPPNPSHLEAVNPVVEGIVRAMQDRQDRGHEGIYPVVPVLMHGDSAFAGQGVVVETLHLSQLRGYRTGGTIHIVINNQVGFTTSPEASRSSFYATDVAKTVQAPILHVNGDDPEAVVRVARLAYAYRETFHRDIVIDLVCYRKHGHNEADDPSFTQPAMYELIRNQRSVRKLYTERLVRRGDISIEQAERFLEDFESRLELAFDETKQAAPPEPPRAVEPVERGVLPPVATGVDRGHLDRIAAVQFEVPDGFTRHPKLERIFNKARERYDQGVIDWAMGETLAFGSVLLEGHDVRLAGQDSRRGTFSHRHAVQVDYRTGAEHKPLSQLAPEQGRWFVYDSLLSEYAALGFEYGYSVEARDALVCWEAQFGDFVNGAQIVIDQFIVAAEDKWGQTSGLVLLLPHGYEGQGPEHSSARIERFLILSAEDNIQVVNATTSAQLFHVLRRQMHREVRKPLVIFTPKSLLRSPKSAAPLAAFTSGSFQEVLDDPAFTPRDAGDGDGGSGRDLAEVRSVLLCSGKIAYDLMAERDERSAAAAVVRLEQLYPFPDQLLGEVFARYPNASDVCWVQEEPENMGPWGFVDGRLWNLLESIGDDRRLRHATRVPSASPAAGQHVVHEQEHEQLLAAALDPATP
jgi:multifunctional 2-oxoglutarate metabolism enzyme